MSLVDDNTGKAVVEDEFARRWLQIQADFGLAANTVKAYGQGLDESCSVLRARAIITLQK